MVIKCVVLVKEQTNRLAEQNRKLRKRPTNTVKWSLKKPIQWRKDSLSTNVLSIEQLDSNVQKKKTTSVQFYACPPSIQTPTSTTFSGEHVSAILEAVNIPSLPTSSHFMSNHSRVRSKLTELLGQLTLSVSDFSPVPISYQFLSFLLST